MPINARRHLKLSDRAQAKIRDLMKARGVPRATVRVFAERRDDGALELGLAFDERRAANLEFLEEGLTLVADPETLSMAGERVIDYATEGFTFTRDGACETPFIPE